MHTAHAKGVGHPAIVGGAVDYGRGDSAAYKLVATAHQKIVAADRYAVRGLLEPDVAGAPCKQDRNGAIRFALVIGQEVGLSDVFARGEADQFLGPAPGRGQHQQSYLQHYQCARHGALQRSIAYDGTPAQILKYNYDDGLASLSRAAALSEEAHP